MKKTYKTYKRLVVHVLNIKILINLTQFERIDFIYTAF